MKVTHPCTRTRIMVCRLVLNARASADTLSPAVSRALTSVCCSSLNDDGRPKRLPACRARSSPAWVRSINRSRGHLTKRKLKHAKGFAVSLVSHQPKSDIPWLAQSGVHAQSEPWSYRSLPVAARCCACQQRSAFDPDISPLF